MKNKIISLFMVCVMVMSLFTFMPLSVSAATEVYYTYTVSNGEAIITDVNESIAGDIVIPSTRGGYPVTTIGDSAFSGCSRLTSVEIGDSVTRIGYRAFYNCKSLTSVEIPDSVTTIGDEAFVACNSLTSVEIPDSVTTIGRYAFSSCTSLTSISVSKNNNYYCDENGVLFNKEMTTIVCYPARKTDESYTIPDSVTTIGESAFYKCISLTSIEIPDSVTTIGEDAFYNTKWYDNQRSNLVYAGKVLYKYKGTMPENMEITIKGGTKGIADSAFSYCTGLTSIKIPDSVTTIGDSAFYKCISLKSVEIPDSVTTIGDSAFSDCRSLTSVEIPDSVTEIGEYAFGGCTSLTSIEIPDGVTTINGSAFSVCIRLTSINVSENNNSYCAENGVLFNERKTAIICYPEGKTDTSYIIPDSVTTIGDSAFSSCTSLKSVEIPDSVTTIGDSAFSNCISLKSVEIPDSVTTIGDSAFSYCRSLTSVEIPDSVTEIGEYAFGGCTSLTSIEIPDSVTTIGWYAFGGCTSLTSIEIPDSVTTIGSFAFSDCRSLTSVEIPDSVTTIGDSAFSSCRSLTSVKIPDSVITIGNRAFSYCRSLTSIEISDSVITIGNNAFYDCENLRMVKISYSVTEIGNSTFYGCENLTDVYYTGTEAQWNKISIDSSNYYLTMAKKHYNYINKSDGASSGVTDSVNNKDLGKLSIAIYQNNKDSSKTVDSYVLSKGAEVTNGTDSAVSDAKGLVVIKTGGNDITVKKDGYLSRTFTEARAKKLKSVHLQQNKGTRPIIQAVWVGDTDVYNHDCEIDLTSKEPVIIIAEVAWMGGAQKKIYLMQESRKVEFTEDKLTTVLSDNFDVSKDIYIVAEDVKGNTTQKKLKFKAGGGVSDVLNDYKLSFGDSVTGTIPASIPVIGGSKVGLDIPLIPLTVTFENNKFYAVLGLDVVKATNNYSFIENVNGTSHSKFEKSTKLLCENIKDSFKNSADSYSFSKLKTKWMKAKYNYSATMGFEGDLTVIGYLEGYVDSNNDVVILDGGVGVNPSVGISVGSQIIPVPPLYWEASLKGEIAAMLNLYINKTAKNFKPNGTVSVDVTLNGGVGLGASKVIGISGGVEGNIGVDWNIYLNQQDYININGSIGAYAKAFVGPLTLFEKSFPFASGTIWDYPSTRVNSLYLSENMNFYDTSSYSLIDRSYVQAESDFIANDRLFYSYLPTNKVEKTLKTNVYTYSEPQIAEFSDGSMIVAWLDDDLSRSDINRTALYYSYYDGSNWTEPAQVDNDKTGDYSPSVAVIEDEAYITWVNSKEELSNDAEISKVFGSWEISAAKFNKENKKFGNACAVTSDSFIDTSPEIFGDKTGVKLAWVRNTSGDIFNEGNTYSVLTSTLNSDNWSSPVVYAENIMPVDSMDGCIYNGKTYIAYSIDVDGNLNDYTDKEIYLNNVRLTENETLDSNPVFDSGKLYFYADGTIDEYDLLSNTQKTVVDTISVDRFNVISNGENKVLMYAQTDSLEKEINAIIYHGSTDKWGKSIPLTELKSNISSYSGSLSADGKITIAVNKTEITGDINSGNPYGQTDISLFTVNPSCDLAIDNVVYHEELLMKGNTVEFYTQITNKGEVAVDNYAVKVVDANGKTLGVTYSEVPILPGEVIDFTAYYPLGDKEFKPHDISLVVYVYGNSDVDESDNSYNVSLNYENVSLENIAYGVNVNGNAEIYADIVNRGYGVCDKITATLRKDSSDGEIADTVIINEKLNTLDSVAVSFSVPYVEGSVYYITLDQAGKNDGFVVLGDLETEIIVFNEENNMVNINSFEKVEKAELFVGTYKKNKMVELNSKKVEINEGKNLVESPTTNFDGADKVKVFVWESLMTLKPVYEPIEKSL